MELRGSLISDFLWQTSIRDSKSEIRQSLHFELCISIRVKRVMSQEDYKRSDMVLSFFHHSLQLNLKQFTHIQVKSLPLFVFRSAMVQSDFLKSEMEEKSLTAVSLKLRIKVPHFDNKALIEGYSRTLIGRCMNPRAQNMKNLLYMLPRIWQMEDRVAGADLRMG